MTRPQKRPAVKKPAPRHQLSANGRLARRGAIRPGAPVLSACLIVKDEEEALPGCLASLHHLVDEVVVYDTGSTDATVELARQAGARVVEGYWDDDFSRARNACLEECRGSWILWVDADERFVCDEIRELRGRLERVQDVDALLVEICNVEADASAPFIAHRAMRIFRKDRCRWHGTLHEQVELRPDCPGIVRARALDGAHIDHLGYQERLVLGRDKLARNLRLAEAALAAGETRPRYRGTPQLNVARALGAIGRLAEAQEHFDIALTEVPEGLPTRNLLLYSTQNLLSLGRCEEALASARQLQEISQKKDLAYYLEGMAHRRLGRPEAAVAMLRRIGALTNEDGFSFPDSLLRAEMAGALMEAGKPGEAADELVLLVEQTSNVNHITAALGAFAAAGRSLTALAAAMPEDRLDKVAAALTIVPAPLADEMAEALVARFGPRPPLLAAATRFGPLLSAPRALEWSARLRSIGMTLPCPLIARADLDELPPAERVRAATTAYAAFGDERGSEAAVRLAPEIPAVGIVDALTEVSMLSPGLLGAFSRAMAGPEAAGEGRLGPRGEAVVQALGGLGHVELGAQIRKETDLLRRASRPHAQFVTAGADRS